MFAGTLDNPVAAFDDGLDPAGRSPPPTPPSLHGWVTEDRAAFWGMTDCDEERVREIYEYIDEQDHLAAYLFVVDGTPVGLLQTYDPEVDEIGEWYDRRAGDVGIHLLLADEPARAGRTEEMIAAGMAFVSSQAGVRAAGVRARRPQRGVAGDDGADRRGAGAAGRHEDEHRGEAGAVLLPGARPDVAERMNQAVAPRRSSFCTTPDKKESPRGHQPHPAEHHPRPLPGGRRRHLPHGPRVASDPRPGRAQPAAAAPGRPGHPVRPVARAARVRLGEARPAGHAAGGVEQRRRARQPRRAQPGARRADRRADQARRPGPRTTSPSRTGRTRSSPASRSASPPPATRWRPTSSCARRSSPRSRASPTLRQVRRTAA